MHPSAVSEKQFEMKHRNGKSKWQTQTFRSYRDGKCFSNSVDEKLPIIEASQKERDVFSITGFQKKILNFLPLTTTASILINVYYWWLQTCILRRLGGAGADLDAAIRMKWTFMIVDIICKVPTYLKQLIDSLAMLNGTWTPRLRILGDNVPAVDVAIVCSKEDTAVILDSIHAALNTDYPDDRFRLIVSDDGAQKKIEEGVKQLQRQYPHRDLHYTARVKTPASSHKAGNLNHILEYTSKLPGGRAPFLAGLDADMIVNPKWLRAQLPHLLLDSKMAFTCPLPRFYNIPVDDPLSQSRMVFQHFEEVIKDQAGFPWCTGSGWVMRRDVLEQIGGFPTQSSTEDVLCGYLMLGAGWKALYVPEELQWGMVPSSYHAYIKQRKRWSTGVIEAGLVMRFCLFGKRAGNMNSRQRAFGFSYPFITATASLKVLEIVTSAVLFAAGSSNVVFANIDDLKLLVRVAAVAWLFRFLCQCQIAVICGYATTFREMACLNCLDLYCAYDHWKNFLLPTWLGGSPDAFTAKFVATGSIVDELHERTENLRAPLSRRLKSVLIQDGAIFHFLIALVYIIALPLNYQKAVLLHADDVWEFRIYLLTRLLWVPPMWPLHIATLLKPLWYSLFPPSIPDREKLLKRDETGLAYPTEDSKRHKLTWKGFGIEILETLSLIYVVGIFISTWWW